MGKKLGTVTETPRMQSHRRHPTSSYLKGRSKPNSQCSKITTTESTTTRADRTTRWHGRMTEWVSIRGTWRAPPPKDFGFWSHLPSPRWRAPPPEQLSQAPLQLEERDNRTPEMGPGLERAQNCEEPVQGLWRQGSRPSQSKSSTTTMKGSIGHTTEIVGTGTHPRGSTPRSWRTQEGQELNKEGAGTLPPYRDFYKNNNKVERPIRVAHYHHNRCHQHMNQTQPCLHILLTMVFN